ncbi:L,D-transpeptidase [Microbacterium sp. ET2]|uniref:L,D-transpeptidase family protein n=1 Tax=Microbacterium albipurpureum TaxID=3050384 RepID=UPI00259D27EA|nr:L,D-transpeptidase [Microbacterium sp. ET2 (Ac-2212)]WJL95001.1 L,D-transpeptidase [Microbacterium sp. ET2 (Ac-2212)]
MTDLVTRPDADGAAESRPQAADTADAPTSDVPGGDAPTYAWAPAEPTPKKRRWGLWIGVTAAAAAIGMVAASVFLIAPGTAVAGVPVGFLTPGAAAAAIETRLAETTVVLTGPAGDAELTGADLGATVNAQALAETAFAEHPMWNPTGWFPSPVDAEVQLDPVVAADALLAAAPDLSVSPVDAVVAFDTASASYQVTPAVPGEGIDADAVRQSLQDAFLAGEQRVEVAPTLAVVEAETTTTIAEATASRLNAMLDTAGFYIGDERTVPLDRAVVASWITLGDGDRGTISIEVDQAGIQSVVDTLPGLVDREAVDATVITNRAGTVLREDVAGVNGRALESTDGLAADAASQLAAGDGVIELGVTETPFATVALARSVEVDLSAQRAYLFENGNMVESFTISSGTAATPTPTGNFTVFAYTRVQDMGALCYNPDAVNSYCTEDVPYITWFAPDIAFHGASNFRSSLGYPQSHGCVNMWDDAARFIYEWTATGTEVSVYS